VRKNPPLLIHDTVSVYEKMKNWIEILEKEGYIHLQNQDEESLNSIIERLGKVIMTTDVKINRNSRALVTSSRALDFHTDHHSAKYIVWYCYKQCSEGGYSIILNAENVYQKLSKKEQEELKKINLFEHKIFPDDKENHPLVQEQNGQRKFYYSFWLVNANDKKNLALQKFKKLISTSNFDKILMHPRDILIVNNHKVFHGRTEIKGNQQRYLKRYWIK